MIYLAAYTYYTFASSSHQANFGVVMRGAVWQWRRHYRMLPLPPPCTLNLFYSKRF